MTEILIRAALVANPDLASQMSYDRWAAEQQIRGDKVRLFRDYADGDHRANMTDQMRRLLRISNTGSLREFNDNYMDVVIQSMSDRLQVSSIDSDIDAARVWATDLLKYERFDAMQTNVHEAAIRDGDTYLMAYYDNDLQRTCFAHELAYDGVDGIVVLYDTATSTTPSLAIKIWHLTLSQDGGTVTQTARVNVYYPDHIMRYISYGGSGNLLPYRDHSDGPRSSWVDRAGKSLGVPIIHFRNRKAMYDSYGMSEIENAIPLQDALNRLLYSTVMVYELTAFRILVAKGFQAPAALTPGMIVNISAEGMDKDDVAELTAIDGADPTPFLAGMQHLVGEIGNVTNTPRLSPQHTSGDRASGESLKQREIGLLGKLNRFQVKAGNAWEDLLKLAAVIQGAFGNGAPSPEAEYTTKWVNAEIRNDEQLVKSALSLVGVLDQRTILELVAPVFDFDSDKIDEIMAAKQAEAAQQMAQQQAMNVNAQTPPTNGTAPVNGSATTPTGARALVDIYAAANMSANGNGAQPVANGATA